MKYLNDCTITLVKIVKDDSCTGTVTYLANREVVRRPGAS